eukprot:CAMPEP_0178908700 /NCGR_PEP_ID=MMETSP0786-20121207/8068_1 /TAXON_ID=186022 /ORGANISM="Thalassionema frauenfeldii, Strain CCMP 1798" /LENGTH=218 /DNA_ID=CAMNT_0020580631 /DNA_START=259 /DNA_END=915 /DNA_ORIENTATION=+
MIRKSTDATKTTRANFPYRLHMLLSQAKELGVDNILSWHPSGTKFVIYNQGDFVTKILPTVFSQTKFASFRRQLNAYGFERELNPNKSSDSASFLIYSHIHFKRDDPQSCKTIPRRRKNQFFWERVTGLCSATYKVPLFSSLTDDEKRSVSSNDSSTMTKSSKHRDNVLSATNDVVLDELASVAVSGDMPPIECSSTDMIAWDPKTESLSSQENILSD